MSFLKNSEPLKPAPDFKANAAAAVIAGTDKGRLGQKVEWRDPKTGKTMNVAHNVRVYGSEDRNVNEMTPVYRDAAGRYSTKGPGRQVGVIMWGGTNGRNCHVALFPDA